MKATTLDQDTGGAAVVTIEWLSVQSTCSDALREKFKPYVKRSAVPSVGISVL